MCGLRSFSSRRETAILSCYAAVRSGRQRRSCKHRERLEHFGDFPKIVATSANQRAVICDLAQDPGDFNRTNISLAGGDVSCAFNAANNTTIGNYGSSGGNIVPVLLVILFTSYEAATAGVVLLEQRVGNELDACVEL